MQSARRVTRRQSVKLLETARDSARLVQPKRLGAVGDVFSTQVYACSLGIAQFGTAEPRAHIPFVVEAWASKTARRHQLEGLREPHADNRRD